jgi:hypothetical protein
MIRHELFQDSILNKSRRSYNTARLQRVFFNDDLLLSSQAARNAWNLLIINRT